MVVVEGGNVLNRVKGRGIVREEDMSGWNMSRGNMSGS